MQKKGGKKNPGLLPAAWFFLIFFFSLQNSAHKIKALFICSDAKKKIICCEKVNMPWRETKLAKIVCCPSFPPPWEKAIVNNLVLLLSSHGIKAYTLRFVAANTNLLVNITQLRYPFQPCLLMKKVTVKTRGFSCTCQYFKGYYISWHQCLGFLVSENCGDHL